MNNRWKIIFIATLFNLLFEYSLRGFNNISAQPSLPFILFATYFTLYIMVEDLIVRFKLKDYHLMMLSFVYGTIYCAFTSGLAFINPTFLGVAWGPLILINLVWWGALQAVLCFYLANWFNPRDWNHARLSKFGWIGCIAGTVFVLFLFQKSGVIPLGTPLGRLTVWVIVLLSGIVCSISFRKNRQSKSPAFVKSRLLTILSFATIALFLFTAMFLTHDPIQANTSNVNSTSLRIISSYTLILSIALLAYRIRSKKSIPV